ncbi:hypothetical protein Acr_00g0090120 [Actinidia rufa]|uniref:Uncharacterized protein n=1 Tax=Actinidia rufa TaxID=165716 RepID=A0A7J0DZA6_9ERIC|nr:hypothetical protein Acr_00g0090120 [Actinidia rufa]
MMTQGKLNCLRESCSFPTGIQIRLPEVDETIVSTRPGEVAFCEAVLQTGRRYNVLIETKQERFDQISGTLEQGQLYPIKDVLCSKSSLQSFALDFGRMVSSGVDNVEEKPMGNTAHIAANEGESHLSQGDPPKLSFLYWGASSSSSTSEACNVKEDGLEKARPTSQREGRANKRRTPKRRGPCYRLMTRKKGPTGKASTKSKETSSRVVIKEVPSSAAPREGTLANPRVVLVLEASTKKNPVVAEKLIQGLILLDDNKAVDKLDLDRAITRVAKLEAKKEYVTEKLRRMKKEHDVALERHPKGVAKLKRKEAFSKTSTIEEFKSLDNHRKL